jgi:hypothetical protein
LPGCRYECFRQPRGDLHSVKTGDRRHVDSVIFLRGVLGNDATSIEPQPSIILIQLAIQHVLRVLYVHTN